MRKKNPAVDVSQVERARGVRKAKVRQGKKCAVCGWERAGVHGHHVIPVAVGGDPSEANVLVLCPNHHAVAHAIGHEIHKRKNGWSAPGVARHRLYNLLMREHAPGPPRAKMIPTNIPSLSPLTSRRKQMHPHDSSHGKTQSRLQVLT